MMFRDNSLKMFNGRHYERIKDFLINTQDNGLNYSLQDLDIDIDADPDDDGDADSTSENNKFLQKKMKHKSYEIIEHIKEIKSECKVALLLIENSRNIRSVDLKIGGIAIRAEIVKIDFLMKNLKRSDHLT